MNDDAKEKVPNVPMPLSDGFITFTFTGNSRTRSTTAKFEHMTGMDIEGILAQSARIFRGFPGVTEEMVYAVIKHALELPKEEVRMGKEVNKIVGTTINQLLVIQKAVRQRLASL
jgi:hypothetical protein